MKLKDAANANGWTNFLQFYESFIKHELAQHYPQFARSLCQLEQDTRAEQERQNAQVLSTLRLKDAKILSLQKIVNEQREQLDVVLDELERRETKEDKEVQIRIEMRRGDAAIQTESVQRKVKDSCTQTGKNEEELRICQLLEKLGKDLKLVEDRNVALENELHQRATEKDDKMEDNMIFKDCLKKLQFGMDAMKVSYDCVRSPLTLFVGQSEIESEKSTCVNLEHRLEVQGVRLEHLQACLYAWRDAIVQCMKQHILPDSDTKLVKISPLCPISASQDQGDHRPTIQCFFALRGALAQLRQHTFQQSHQHGASEQQSVVKEFAKALSNEKNGVEIAAKIVQKWAKWEAKHMKEMHALRRGFAEERAEYRNRRIALLKQIDHLEQREMDLQAEVNAWRRKREASKSKCEQELPFFTVNKPENLISGKALEYPQLLARLATVEQSLLVKDEQLAAANATIKALSTCTTGSENSVSIDTGAMNSITQIAGDLQRVSRQKLDVLQQRQTRLVGVSQYFQAEKKCIELESRLGVETQRTAILKAAGKVWNHEREELLRKVEKLETEALFATIQCPPRMSLEQMDNHSASFVERDDDSSALFNALKRIRLIEDNRKSMRDRLLHLQQQVAILQEQSQNGEHVEASKKQTIEMKVANYVAEHHQQCIDHFKKFLDRQRESQDSLSGCNGYEPVKQTQFEWEVLLTHYETLWIAFSFLYSIIKASPQSLGTAQNEPLICAIREVKTDLRLDFLEFEIDKRDEKLLLLQQRLLTQDLQEKSCKHCFHIQTGHTSPHNPFYRSKFGSEIATPLDSRDFAQEVGASGSNLALMKVSTTHFKPGNDLLDTVPPIEAINGQISESKSLIEKHQVRCTEYDARNYYTDLKKCLTKCAYLIPQNSKLNEQLRIEKETNNSEEYVRNREEHFSFSSEEKTEVEEKLDMNMIASDIMNRCQRECEALKEQLGLREADNLALKQSLCKIKEICAQNEVNHEKQLRVKVAEYAESMKNYIFTISETLSRIDNDKCRLLEENSELRFKLHLKMVNENSRIQKMQIESQQCTQSTNTEEVLDLATVVDENTALKARVEDLELELHRERKIVEMPGQRNLIEEQKDNHALKSPVNFESRCEALEEWRNKLQLEFEEYKSVQCACAHESSKRIDFLSACIHEFICVAEAITLKDERSITTNELYCIVMRLAKDQTTIGENTKEPKDLAPKLDDHSNVAVLSKNFRSNGQGKLNSKAEYLEVSEAMWWRLRASKLEAHLRSMMLQNDTFEDTMRQLEKSMGDANGELSLRLQREAQLVSQLAALNSELATVKDSAASIAEKYRFVHQELEKQQAEFLGRSDDLQRSRLALQRKAELLAQQKEKNLLLQQEFDLVGEKLERLAIAEKQITLLQQKAKEHKNQLILARQNSEQCLTDNVRLSIHLKKLNERNARMVARFNATRVENAHLKAQCAKRDSDEITMDENSDNKSCNKRVDEDSEIRALKRRLLQKQDVIGSYKAKLADFELQLQRQREMMMKLGRTNRTLQLKKRQNQEAEHENIDVNILKLDAKLKAKQNQLDGLRASIYDSFEALVSKYSTRRIESKSQLLDSSLMDESRDENEKLFALKSWTNLTCYDLRELKLIKRPQSDEANESKFRNLQAALWKLENALEANPEDCRTELCQLLQYFCI
ncbi:hypothetical protein Plhal304r1_c008g0033301 [Plasmopara halstedii]